MWVLRFAGCACLLWSGWRAGFSISLRQRQRRRTLEQLILLTQQLAQEIALRKAPLTLLLRELQQENAYPLLALQNCVSLQTLTAPVCLYTPERACTEECFSGMGHSAASQECERLAHYAARLENFYAEAQQAEQKALQLYPRLGLCAGAMLAILCM